MVKRRTERKSKRESGVTWIDDIFNPKDIKTILGERKE
jgi:hypothetical protein